MLRVDPLILNPNIGSITPSRRSLSVGPPNLLNNCYAGNIDKPKSTKKNKRKGKNRLCDKTDDTGDGSGEHERASS